MSTPNGIATSAPTSSSTGLPGLKRSSPNSSPPAVENSNVAHAPMPTNVICASEIWPDQPVSGTSDTMISAVTQREREAADVRPVEHARERSSTPTNTIAMPKSARLHADRARGRLIVDERPALDAVLRAGTAARGTG